MEAPKSALGQMIAKETNVQYVMLCYVDPATRPEVGGLINEWFDHFDQLGARGQYVSGSRFQDEDTATSVRIRNGEVSRVNKPAGSGTERLSGFYIIEAESAEAAIAWAEKSPVAPIGTVEVRPLIESAVPERPAGFMRRLLNGAG